MNRATTGGGGYVFSRFRKACGALVLVGGLGAVAFSDTVEYVPARDYYSVVQREIGQARSSVSVGLYLFSFRSEEVHSPVVALAESLQRAHQAGVRVEVLLDQNFNFLEGEPFDPSEGKNTSAYGFLKACGVPVYFDSPATYTHSKVVVIDGKTVILGSSNWSSSAFNRNEEANVLIRSTEVARRALAALSAIPRVTPGEDDDEHVVSVPGEFLENPVLLGRMITTPDERAFDAYLYLLKQSSSSFTLNDQALAAALGIGHMDRTSYRRQIQRTLRKLQTKYGLIQIRSSFNQNIEITMGPLKKSPPGGEEAHFVESVRSARVPERYWSLGWDRRLSFAGKCFFLVGRYESEVSTLRPRWSVARSTLARRYGGAGPFWGAGVTDLRRWNLLEVEYAPYGEAGGVPRKPTVYTPNALFDPAETEKRFDGLLLKYGTEAMGRVRRAAAMVYEDHDVQGITQLLELDRRYGAERLDEAVRLVGLKNPDNPHRSMAYLIGVARGLADPPRD